MTTVLTQTVARLLLLPTIVTSLAMLVKGYSDVGDGFSAGAVAATGMSLQYIAFGYREAEKILPPGIGPPLAFMGLLLTFLVGFLPALWGSPIITHFPRQGAEVAHLGTLELHTGILFDAGIYLLVVGFILSVVGWIARTKEEVS